MYWLYHQRQLFIPDRAPHHAIDESKADDKHVGKHKHVVGEEDRAVRDEQSAGGVVGALAPNRIAAKQRKRR